MINFRYGLIFVLKSFEKYVLESFKQCKFVDRATAGQLLLFLFSSIGIFFNLLSIRPFVLISIAFSEIKRLAASVCDVYMCVQLLISFQVENFQNCLFYTHIYFVDRCVYHTKGKQRKKKQQNKSNKLSMNRKATIKSKKTPVL